jgi:hypothetical protein
VVFVQKHIVIRKIMRRLSAFITVIIILLSGSCTKIQHLPPEPYIEYRNFAVFDTIDILGNYCKGGRLKFYFEDGDGNLGLESPEDTGQDTTNLFLTLYRKTNGVMEVVPDDDLMKPSSYRIPYMKRDGQNKILKGTISVTFIYLFYLPETNDTVMYEFYLKDRAENFSNTEKTSEIPLSFNGIY